MDRCDSGGSARDVGTLPGAGAWVARQPRLDARPPITVRLPSRRRLTLVGLARRLPSDHSPWPP